MEFYGRDSDTMEVHGIEPCGIIAPYRIKPDGTEPLGIKDDNIQPHGVVCTAMSFDSRKTGGF